MRERRNACRKKKEGERRISSERKGEEGISGKDEKNKKMKVEWECGEINHEKGILQERGIDIKKGECRERLKKG